MKFLHLDPQFTPYGKSIDFKQFTFSGGEPHIKIYGALESTDVVMITHRIQTFNDLGTVLIAHDALKRLGIQDMELFIPYFPAARQDRVMVPGEPLSVKVVANLINGMGFRKVKVFDVHSEVTAALVENIEVISNIDFIKKVVTPLDEYCLVSPDGGALKKIYGVAKALGGAEVVEGAKLRDVSTGLLKDFKVYADDLEGKTCVVVDDICDGGGTFIGLAKKLKEKGAGKLLLLCSHGIFSKGFEDLLKLYDAVYCTDAFSTIHEPYVKQICLSDLYLKP